MQTRYDVIVLGAGNAGMAAAGAARAAGRSVLIVEGRDVGGVCPLRGCVPKKVLVAAAQVLDVIERAESHAISVGTAKLDWKRLIERERTFVDGVPEEFEASLHKRGIILVRGRARFVDRRRVVVDDTIYHGDKIVVATGSKPRPLPIPGAEYLATSDDLLELAELPASVTFVGAGVIAFELAHVFARAGTRVTLLEVGSRVLPALDAGAAEQIAAATRAIGVSIQTGVEIRRIERGAQAHSIEYALDGEAIVAGADIVVNGAGRVADIDGLELGNAGIAITRGRVALDDTLRSIDNPNVYFAGDAIPGRPQLSPVATYEGRIVGHNLVDPADPRIAVYDHIPAAIHTVPSVASVGLSEEAARAAGIEVDVHVNDLRQWRSARTHAEKVAWSKVLVEKDSGRIVGAHLVGHGAEETVHSFALAIEKGITASEIAERVYAYPTFHSDLKFLVGPVPAGTASRRLERPRSVAA